MRGFLEERRRLSAAEDHSGGEEDEYEETVEDAVEEQVAEALAEVLTAASDDTEDLFVEVGDRVIYSLVDDPNERHSVLIVDSGSNAKMGIVNEQTPLAQALLGLSPGDVGELQIPGQKARQLRVLKIQRQEELLM